MPNMFYMFDKRYERSLHVQLILKNVERVAKRKTRLWSCIYM